MSWRANGARSACASAASSAIVAADEAGLYRDALGAVPPGGSARGFLERRARRAARAGRALRRTHGPFTTARGRATLRRRLSARCCASSSATASWCAASCGPGGSEREWCDVEVLRRLRRASLAALRKEIEPADAAAPGARSCPPGRASIATPPAGAGIDRLREVLVPLQGLALPVEIWERDVLPRRIGAYSPAWLDQLCASGEVVWVGAGALGRSGRVALYFREDAPLIGPPGRRAGAGPPSGRRARAAAQAPGARRRASSPTCSPSSSPRAGRALREALWDLVWAGEVTNDAWAPLRAPRLSLARGAPGEPGARAGAGAPSRRPTRWPRRGAGAQRRSRALVADRVAVRRARASAGPPASSSGAACSRSCCSSATASSPASRFWPRGSGRLCAALRRFCAAGDARRLPPRLLRRGHGRRAVRAPRRGRAPARGDSDSQAARRGGQPARSCSPPPTPLSPTARRWPGRRREGQAAPAGPGRGRLCGARRGRAGALRRARRARTGTAREARRCGRGGAGAPAAPAAGMSPAHGAGGAGRGGPRAGGWASSRWSGSTASRRSPRRSRRR